MREEVMPRREGERLNNMFQLAFGRASKRARLTVAVSAMAITALLPATAFAQRAGDNVLNSADDAFGTTVGNETIGVYDARNARGFNPAASGNVRIEGMYVDRPFSGPGEVIIDRLMASSSIRVGITTQSYPFPAPSGIVDVSLRIPRDKSVVSVVTTYGPYDTYGIEIDGQTPVNDKLSIGGGVEFLRFSSDVGTTANDWSAGALARWTPNDSIEVTPFWGRFERRDFENSPWIFPAGDTMPPRIKRRVAYSQEWGDFEQYETNFGFLGRARLSDAWVLRTSFFRANYYRATDILSVFSNTLQDGSADLAFYSSPPQRTKSYSGEVRLSGVFAEGPRRHTLHFTARARDGERLYGGTHIQRVGRAVIGVPVPVAMPAFVHNPRGLDETKQVTGGLVYDAQWRSVGTLSLGLQKTKYDRMVTQANLAPTTNKSTPWLYNVAASARVTDKMMVFGSYARGLEDSGNAPQAARNRGEAAPASITQQIDAGFTYAITQQIKFVSTAFVIEKPYYDRDPTNLFTDIGDLSHKGLEFSLTGQPLPGLTMIGGLVLLKARVSGPLVDLGLIGSVPVGRDSRAMRFDLQYGPASWNGLSVDGQLEHIIKGYAGQLNTANIPPRTVLNLGARYRFKIGEAPSTLRVRVQNVTNTFAWENGGGANAFLQYLGPRRVTVSLATDL
jgi:iron complex outermembrane receptor protein